MLTKVQYLTKNKQYTNPTYITPKGIVIHSTGCKQRKISAYFWQFNTATVGASVHGFLGLDDNGELCYTQTLPYTYKTAGCGSGKNGSYNGTHIQFEICEDTTSKAWTDETYDAALEICKKLCIEYGITPDNVTTHCEAHERGYASNHADIMHWWSIYGRSIEQFRKDLKARMGMEYICEPKKLSIYVNNGRKTIQQVKQETGCSAIINGGLYDMDKWLPVAQLRVVGQTLACENWGVNYGFGWDADFTNFHMTPTMSNDNFIACICLVKDGQPVKLTYPSTMGDARPRSALGITKDGKLWLYCTNQNTTPETLQSIAVQKCKNAIMLDGGASSQCVFPNGTIKSAKRPVVENYILVWEKSAVVKEYNVSCPYTEPMTNVKMNSRGEGAKWVQWMLNQCGYSLTVDGIIGAKSNQAICDFQTKHGLSVDGIVGPNTRKVLKSVNEP